MLNQEINHATICDLGNNYKPLMLLLAICTSLPQMIFQIIVVYFNDCLISLKHIAPSVSDEVNTVAAADDDGLL